MYIINLNRSCICIGWILNMTSTALKRPTAARRSHPIGDRPTGPAKASRRQRARKPCDFDKVFIIFAGFTSMSGHFQSELPWI